jgi:hypothetical protein
MRQESLKKQEEEECLTIYYCTVKNDLVTPSQHIQQGNRNMGKARESPVVARHICTAVQELENRM